MIPESPSNAPGFKLLTRPSGTHQVLYLLIHPGPVNSTLGAKHALEYTLFDGPRVSPSTPGPVMPLE